jgi:hypothetical protein
MYMLGVLTGIMAGGILFLAGSSMFVEWWARRLAWPRFPVQAAREVSFWGR